MSGKNLGGGYAARHTLGNIRKKALSGDVQDSQIAYYLGCRDPCCGESKDRWVAGAACPFTTIDERETAKEEKSKEAKMAEATTGSLNQSLTDNRWYAIRPLVGSGVVPGLGHD